MAYNKKNYYKRIVKLQELVKQEKHNNGLSYKEIYWKYVEPQFHISIRTYHEWLGIPAQRELKKIEEQENNKSQLKFDF